MKKIIVQAGGLGTRLGKLTFNKPKSIVSVKNLPMLFYLFQKYPDAEFIIIGDYKFEVLKNYLNVFAKDYKYKLIKSYGKGNVCGIKEALNYVDENQKFLILWSDLILSEDFKPENLPKGNYVGIFDNIFCSRKFVNGKLEKISTKTDGVAGCFLFENKLGFETLPEQGSFAEWLNGSGLKLQSMNMHESYEVGTLENIKSLKDTENKCRPYNKMEFTNDKVTKIGLTKSGNDLIEREVVWYEKMMEYGFTSIPQIYNLRPLEMNRIDGTNIFQASLADEQKKSVLKNLISALHYMHSFENINADKKDLEKEYYTKTIERLISIKDAIPFSENETIIINGKECKNILFQKDDYKEIVEKMLYKTTFCPIHGDCTLTNTMVDSDNNIYFIDARGYFGSKIVLGDIRYDWAKLYYSINGNFDQFNVKNFDLKISENNVSFKISSNGWEFLTEELLSQTKCDVNEIKLIHSIIWLSLASHCWDDYDSMCLAYYNGLYLINEFI